MVQAERVGSHFMLGGGGAATIGARNPHRNYSFYFNPKQTYCSNHPGIQTIKVIFFPCAGLENWAIDNWTYIATLLFGLFQAVHT